MGEVPCILTMELKITVDVGIRRLRRRRRRPTTNQLSWLAGPHASERAMRSVARHCQMRISVAEGGRGTVNSARTLTNHKLYFRSVDGELARLARLVFVRRTRSPSLYFEHVNVSQAQREMMMIRSGLTDDVD